MDYNVHIRKRMALIGRHYLASIKGVLFEVGEVAVDRAPKKGPGYSYRNPSLLTPRTVERYHVVLVRDTSRDNTTDSDKFHPVYSLDKLVQCGDYVIATRDDLLTGRRDRVQAVFMLKFVNYHWVGYQMHRPGRPFTAYKGPTVCRYLRDEEPVLECDKVYSGPCERVSGPEERAMDVQLSEEDIIAMSKN